ncbi:MAG: hypothetical protein ACXADH_15380 [Candidatus Kariarchaeaceae archaeon]|jgi:hypothetical protein
MNTLLSARIKKQLQRELIRRKLIEYFTNKGFENMDMPLYPPSCYDMPIKVPQLFNRVEIIPSVEETDTTLGTVKLSWNLFVMGVNRINLGCTTHTGETDVVRAVLGEPNLNIPADFLHSAQDVIDFVLKILDSSKAGYVELPENFQLPPGALTLPLISKARSPRIGPTASGAFYSR